MYGGGVFRADEKDVTGGYAFINLVSFNENIYLMKNVGIGTTAPDSKLDDFIYSIYLSTYISSV